MRTDLAVDTGDSLMAVELPHAPRAEEPTWCENYCFDIHDQQQGISLWLHLSRSQLHPELWREVVNVFLPDGRIGVWKGYGRGPVHRGRPEGPSLSVDVIVPFEHVTLSSVGVVRLSDERELAAGPVADDLEVAMLLELDWRAATPVWDMRNQMADQVWATGHYEQGGRVTGSLEVAGERWAIRGTGWRDHSMGPRNNAGMQDHDWLHAVFPSGRAVAVFRHSRVGVGQDLGGVFAVDEVGRSCEGQLLSIAPEAALEPTEMASSVRVVIEVGRGPEPLEIEVLRTAWSGSAPPAYQTLGRRTESGHVRTESQARFSWRGENALGILERTRLAAAPAR